MGKHNVKTGDSRTRSRNRKDGHRVMDDTVPKQLRKARARLDKRRKAWEALSMDKKAKTTRPGSMKTRTN